jgi:hypothetical protein
MTRNARRTCIAALVAALLEPGSSGAGARRLRDKAMSGSLLWLASRYC